MSTKSLSPIYHRSLFLFLCLTIITSTLATTPAKAQTQSAPTWREVGVLPSSQNNRSYCFDGAQPNVLLVGEINQYDGKPVGTSSYNWVNGQRSNLSINSFINQTNLTNCNETTGLIYQGKLGANTSPVVFSSADPRGRQLEHVVTNFAKDGSLQVYSVEDGRLFASADGGITWQERGQQFNRKLSSLYVTNVDGQAIYAIVTDANAEQKRATDTLYFSPDAGTTWEKRYEQQRDYLNGTVPLAYTLENFNMPTAPVTTVLMSQRNGGGPSSSILTYYLSSNGGRTFKVVGRTGNGVQAPLFDLAFFGNTIWRIHGYSSTMKIDGLDFFTVSNDGGNTWRTLPSPPTNEGPKFRVKLFQPFNSPSNLFWQYNEDLWYSADLGQSWQKVATKKDLYIIGFTPYSPHSLLAIGNGDTINVLDLPDVSKGLTKGVVASGAAGNNFYDATSHNLPRVFRTYWESKGGLAQFGYPKTEPFREVNAADGKIYTVQYYERNRFEYHPENRGTQYEVLLGLLGNQLTEPRRARNESSFQSVPDPKLNTQLYFPETGHTLRLSFLKYWQERDGLAIYGYPISEEFEEVNPDDGKTYIVQYFERNRFEFHAENRGTQYEVLLGLLGNSLLKQKGWL